MLGKNAYLSEVKLRLSESFGDSKGIVIQVGLILPEKSHSQLKVFMQQRYESKNILCFHNLDYNLGNEPLQGCVLMINIFKVQKQKYSIIGYVQMQLDQLNQKSSFETKEYICSQQNPNQNVGIAYIYFDNKSEWIADNIPKSFLSISGISFARLGKLKDDEGFIFSIYSQEKTHFHCPIVFINMKNEEQDIEIYIPDIKRFQIFHFTVKKSQQTYEKSRFQAKGSIFIDSLQAEKQISHKIIINCCDTRKQFCSMSFIYKLSFDKQKTKFISSYKLIRQINILFGKNRSFGIKRQNQAIKIQFQSREQQERSQKSQKSKKSLSKRGSIASITSYQEEQAQKSSFSGPKKRGSKRNSSFFNIYCQKKNRKMSAEVKRIKDQLFNKKVTNQKQLPKSTLSINFSSKAIFQLGIREFFTQGIEGAIQNQMPLENNEQELNSEDIGQQGNDLPSEVFKQSFLRRNITFQNTFKSGFINSKQQLSNG